MSRWLLQQTAGGNGCRKKKSLSRFSFYFYRSSFANSRFLQLCFVSLKIDKFLIYSMNDWAIFYYESNKTNKNSECDVKGDEDETWAQRRAEWVSLCCFHLQNFKCLVINNNFWTRYIINSFFYLSFWDCHLMLMRKLCNIPSS